MSNVPREGLVSLLRTLRDGGVSEASSTVDSTYQRDRLRTLARIGLFHGKEAGEELLMNKNLGMVARNRSRRGNQNQLPKAGEAKAMNDGDLREQSNRARATMKKSDQLNALVQQMNEYMSRGEHVPPQLWRKYDKVFGTSQAKAEREARRAAKAEQDRLRLAAPLKKSRKRVKISVEAKQAQYKSKGTWSRGEINQLNRIRSSTAMPRNNATARADFIESVARRHVVFYPHRTQDEVVEKLDWMLKNNVLGGRVAIQQVFTEEEMRRLREQMLSPRYPKSKEALEEEERLKQAMEAPKRRRRKAKKKKRRPQRRETDEAGEAGGVVAEDEEGDVAEREQACGHGGAAVDGRSRRRRRHEQEEEEERAAAAADGLVTGRGSRPRRKPLAQTTGGGGRQQTRPTRSVDRATGMRRTAARGARTASVRRLESGDTTDTDTDDQEDDAEEQDSSDVTDTEDEEDADDGGADDGEQGEETENDGKGDAEPPMASTTSLPALGNTPSSLAPGRSSTRQPKTQPGPNLMYTSLGSQASSERRSSPGFTFHGKGASRNDLLDYRKIEHLPSPDSYRAKWQTVRPSAAAYSLASRPGGTGNLTSDPEVLDPMSAMHVDIKDSLGHQPESHRASSRTMTFAKADNVVLIQV